MLVIVGTRTDAHSLRNQVGIGSESDCLLGQLDKILRISDSEAGMKKRNQEVLYEKRVSVKMLAFLETDRRKFDILYVKT